MFHLCDWSFSSFSPVGDSSSCLLSCFPSLFIYGNVGGVISTCWGRGNGWCDEDQCHVNSLAGREDLQMVQDRRQLFLLIWKRIQCIEGWRRFPLEAPVLNKTRSHVWFCLFVLSHESIHICAASLWQHAVLHPATAKSKEYFLFSMKAVFTFFLFFFYDYLFTSVELQVNTSLDIFFPLDILDSVWCFMSHLYLYHYNSIFTNPNWASSNVYKYLVSENDPVFFTFVLVFFFLTHLFLNRYPTSPSTHLFPFYCPVWNTQTFSWEIKHLFFRQIMAGTPAHDIGGHTPHPSIWELWNLMFFFFLVLCVCPSLHFQPSLVIYQNPGEQHQQHSMRQRKEVFSHRKSGKSKEGGKDQNDRMTYLQSHTSGKHEGQTGYWRDGTLWSENPIYSPL